MQSYNSYISIFTLIVLFLSMSFFTQEIKLIKKKIFSCSGMTNLYYPIPTHVTQPVSRGSETLTKKGGNFFFLKYNLNSVWRMEDPAATLQKITVLIVQRCKKSMQCNYQSQENMPQARKLLRINVYSAAFLPEAYLPDFDR